MTLTLICSRCDATDEWEAESFNNVTAAATTAGWDFMVPLCPIHVGGDTE